MPIISMFYGITIRLCFSDNAYRRLPHIPRSTPSLRRP